MQKKLSINIIISNPPIGLIAGKEGVDLALVCAAFDYQVNLIFVDEGVFHLIDKQNAEYFLDKLHDKQLKALAFYDIDCIYVEKQSLFKFDLAQDKLLADCIVIDTAKIKQLVSDGHQTVKF